MEPMIKCYYSRLVNTVHISHEDRSNRMAITTHFVKNTNNISCA